MSEIELHQNPGTDLAGQMSYARAVQTAAMLPESYRGKPADILLAVGLGQSMGLSPAESLYRISVIKGKPTASAELIAAQVRKAGHKLRVVTEGQSVKATVVRADDPDFEHTVVRDMQWAQRMGLDKNDNYRKQPETMLQWRAISAVARLACPEALYGVQYTPDEMSDMTEPRPPGGLGAALSQERPAEHRAEQIDADPETGEIVEDELPIDGADHQYPTNDAQEWRDAANFDLRPTRRISGLAVDADDVPDRADLETP